MLKVLAVIASFISVLLIAFFLCYFRFGLIVIAIPATFVAVCTIFLGAAMSEDYPKFGRTLKIAGTILSILALLPFAPSGPVAYAKAKWNTFNHMLLEKAEQETRPTPTVIIHPPTKEIAVLPTPTPPTHNATKGTPQPTPPPVVIELDPEPQEIHLSDAS